MQDHELYRRILGIEAPWQVARVELQLQQGEVHVYLAHQNNPEWACAECGALGPLYDHQPERAWRHLDTCQYRTILHAAPPRSQCPEHGVRVVKLPWAEPGSRFTELFEALAIEWLKHASQKAVAEQLQLSWDEIPQLGVDEKAFRKGHKYLTLVNDLKRNRVLYVAEDREQSSLDGFWSTITAEQRASIEAVALDMWDPYLASLRDHLPEAEKKIVFDKFHIAKHLGEAVDRVRRREHKALKAEGDERLTGTKYDWLRNPASMDQKQRREFAELRRGELKTARAWALRETAMSLYDCV
jgi:transposase